jgi:glucose/arabinose dehydrogenase
MTVYGSPIPKSVGLRITDSSLKVEQVVSGLDHPTSMAFLNSNDMLILEKNKGTVQRIINGTIQPKPVLDVTVANKSERGLLGIAVAKHENGRTYVFVYFTESRVEGSDVCHKPNYCIPKNSPLGNRLYKYELANGILVNPKLLLDLPALPGPAHNGGKLIIGADRNLYLTIGDLVAHKTRTQNYQGEEDFNRTSGIYRITQEGHPLPNAPLGNDNGLNYYYAYGIRNSFGINFDPVTGKLWDTENGDAFGDEINLVEPGFNSGWSKVQGIWETKNSTFKGRVILNSSGFKAKVTLNPEGLEDFERRGKYSSPEFSWFNTSAPTAIQFLNSDKLGKNYRNDLFVGDYNGGNIYHFDLNENRTSLVLNGSLADKIEDSPKELNGIIFGQGFGPITDLQVGPDGYLYVLSFGKGKVFRIVPQSPSFGEKEKSTLTQ